MKHRYSDIQGLTFPKGSDQEYLEHWETIPGHPLVRKTINGDLILLGKELRTLTITGKGDTSPKSTLKVGDVVSIIPLNGVDLTPFRFEKWSVKYSPWEFQYTWTYIFSEVTS